MDVATCSILYMHYNARKGGLVTERHNKLRNEIYYLVLQVTTSSRVRAKSTIQICHRPMDTLLAHAQVHTQYTTSPLTFNLPQSTHKSGYWFGPTMCSSTVCGSNRPRVCSIFESQTRMRRPISLQPHQTSLHNKNVRRRRNIWRYHHLSSTSFSNSYFH